MVAGSRAGEMSRWCSVHLYQSAAPRSGIRAGGLSACIIAMMFSHSFFFIYDILCFFRIQRDGIGLQRFFSFRTTACRSSTPFFLLSTRDSSCHLVA